MGPTAWAQPAWSGPRPGRRKTARRRRAGAHRGPPGLGTRSVRSFRSCAIATGLRRRALVSSLLVTLLAVALVVDGEDRFAGDLGLAVVAGAARLPGLHLVHGESARGPLLHLEDLDVAGRAFVELLLVLLVAEGHLARAVLPLIEAEVGRALRLPRHRRRPPPTPPPSH